MLIMTMISYIIPEGVRSSVRVCVFCHKFYIQLALPISPEIMDRFWCSRCLNDHIEASHMMGSLASGTTNSLVAKIWTKDLATSCWVYRIWKNGQILMFKVSKWLSQFSWHDRVIWKWRHCLTGGPKRSKKDYSTTMDKIISEASNQKEIPQKWEFWLKIKFWNFQNQKSN